VFDELAKLLKVFYMIGCIINVLTDRTPLIKTFNVEIYRVINSIMGRGSSVGIATSYGLDSRGSVPGRGILLINQTPLHEDLRGNEGIAPPSLTSTLDEGEWSASCPNRFIRRGNATCAHYIGYWVGPQSLYGRCGEETNLLSLPGIEFQFLFHPSRSPSLYGHSNHGSQIQFNVTRKISLTRFSQH
jgi:hypothetical protein